jgi:hypothetical protein
MENHKDWKDRLDQNEVPMDTGKFWDSLESKIPEVQSDKKKRRFFFWLLVFLIASGVTVGGIIFMKTENMATDLAATNLQKPNISDLNNENSSSKSEKVESENLEASNAEKITSNNASSASMNNTRSDQNLQNQTSSSTINKPIALSKSDVSKPGEAKQDSQNANSSIGANDLNSIAIVPMSEYTRITEIENQSVLISSEVSSIGNYAESLDYLPTLASGLSTQQNWKLGSIPSFDNIQKIKTNQSGWQYWMDLSYGIGIAQHSFSTSDQNIQSYLDIRAKYESTLESRLAVWENRLIHPSGLYFSTGLRYQSHITRFDWSKEETKMEWTLADGFVEDAQGNQIAVRDSAWQQYRELREIRQHNTISTLDVPLNIGYIIRKNQFSIEFALGITANIAQYSSGKQLNLQVQPVKWNDADELSFKEFSAGWGSSAMLRASWYPTEYLGIFLQPTYSKDFSNRMISAAGYRHKIDFISIQAGLSFLLFESGK